MANQEACTPYEGHSPSEWLDITRGIIAEHPIKKEEIVQVVLTAWDELHATHIGSRRLQIGVHLFPNPQIIGFFLHEIIPVLIAENHPGEWRREKDKTDKDLVCIGNPKYSAEIKTSSHPSAIFGNRSYAQASTPGARKGKSGYFLTANFVPTRAEAPGKITRVRFGWLDHSDWIGQNSPTGQQARLTTEADRYKLIELYSSVAIKSRVG